MGNLFYTDKGKGKTVIFLHGFCETHDVWNDFLKPFADLRIITLDLPGFGQSPLPSKKISINSIAKIIIEWLHELTIQDAIIIGHSLGGYVTLAIANLQPNLLAGFGLFHSTAYADDKEKKLNRNRTIEFVQKNGVSPYVDAFVPGLFYNKNHPAISVVHEMAVQTNEETLVKYAEAMRDRESRMDVLSKFTNPVLIIGGQKDTIIPIKNLEEQVTFLQKPVLTILEQSAHMGFFEEPELSRLAVQKFVKMCSSM